MSLSAVTVLSSGSGWLLDPRTNQIGPVTLLSAATTTGASQPVDLGDTCEGVFLQTTVTGSPTTVVVTVEGSANGYDWHTITQSDSPTGESRSSGGNFRYLRANLLQLAGGTSPAITVVVAAF